MLELEKLLVIAKVALEGAHRHLHVRWCPLRVLVLHSLPDAIFVFDGRAQVQERPGAHVRD
jgi:hypothetical protein